ncbi:baseplate J/gp47 family protein [Altererythrobacter sp. CC-YST694]|uniref:baseplate assembly protein n=1 Tax=Altererythrobacter sp. CC-YST694 TaxID=2755038 RepID=UPI001D0076C8|nr:baseplate J/gp47 family protein [Altererythrobacter sp. CC-YST694]MCB5423956.1 baseplate J/gp47 family protein [Altererythrobacter sp. CC-YST694]
MPFTAIDLSQLPAPVAVDPLDYEAILAEMLAKYQELFPDFVPVESDPAMRVLQVAAWFRLLDRQKANDDAVGAMLAYATGADLDQIGARFGVQRLQISPADPEQNLPAVMESDADLRFRITLAPEGYSVAGPEGAYLYYALTADSQVASVTARSPAPAEVEIYVLSRAAEGTASPELIATVAAALSDKTVRPIGDRVTVQSATIVPYAIEARITSFAGPDASIVMANAQARIEQFVADNRKIGRDITRAAINSALFVGGAQNVSILSPAEDIVLDDTQAAICTGIAISHAGIAE